MNAQQKQRAEHEGRGVERERLARTDPEHDDGRERRPDQEREVCGRLGQRASVLDHVLWHGLRQQAAVGGLEERLGGAERSLDHHDLPNLNRAGEDQCGQKCMQARAREVGDDHDPVARQPVRPHAAKQDQRHQGQGLGPQHEAEIGRRTCALGDEQRQRDRDRAIADRTGRLTKEQISKTRVAQDAQIRLHRTLSTGWYDGTAGQPRSASAGGGCGRCGHGREVTIIAPGT